MYLVTRNTAKRLSDLGHRNVDQCGKTNKDIKDWTDKELLIYIIHLNLYREITDVIATYGIDAEVRDNGPQWSREVFDVWTYLSTVEKRSDKAFTKKVKPYLDSMAEKLPKGIKQLFTTEVVQKSNHRLMSVPFMVLMHYMITSKANIDKKRLVFRGGNSWKNTLSRAKMEGGPSVSDNILLSDSIDASPRKEAKLRRLGTLGDLALREGDAIDGVIYTLSCLCAHSLVKDADVPDTYIGNAIDFINDIWNEKQNEDTVVLHWDIVDKKKGGEDKLNGKKKKDRFEVSRSEIRAPLTKMIDLILKNTGDVQAKTCLLAHINSLKMTTTKYKNLMAARREIYGQYNLPHEFTADNLYQVLSVLAEESDKKLSNAIRPDTGMIKSALEHDRFEAKIAEGYEKQVDSHKIIVLTMEGDQYRAMLRKIESGTLMTENWMTDFMNIIEDLGNADGWITTFGTKKYMTSKTVPILFGEQEAIELVCGVAYVSPSNKQEQQDDDDDSNSDSDSDDDE